MISLLCDPGYIGLKNYLIGATGLAFYADRDELLTELIGGRLGELGIPDCASYGDFLTQAGTGGSEMDALIAKLTNGETYFFRGEDQFAAIREIILPDILQRNKYTRRLRIWSAGCASGAEPYSLAILLTEMLGSRVSGWQISIDATDLNRTSLTQAAEGKFREWALRSTSRQLKRECFVEQDLVWNIHPRFKEWISFRYLNLAQGEFLPWFTDCQEFDLILCRNVMIYFDQVLTRRLVVQFHQSLGQGGWLVVGSSEHAQETFNVFRSVSSHGQWFYQKMPRSLRRTEVVPEPEKAIGNALVQPSAPWLNWGVTSAQRGTPAGDDVDGLRRLANGGDWQAAAELGRKLLIDDRLNPTIHFYQALILENLGFAAQSERLLRQAIYLDRKLALAHYHLGIALKRDRQMRAAARSFGNVLRSLTGIPGDTIVTAGPGVTATALKELARMHLKISSGS